jgi:hypothetical protein
VNHKQLRDLWVLALGSAGFLHQVFLAVAPNYLIMGGSLTLILGVPIIRLDDRREGGGPQSKPSDVATGGP